MEEIYDATVENLMAALDLRDVETFGHSQTVAKYTEILAKILGLGDSLCLAHLRTGRSFTTSARSPSRTASSRNRAR